MIKVQDFAAKQCVTDRQVQRLLKKYAEELTDHFERRGSNGTWLDDYACSFLRSHMKQQPIVVSDNSISEHMEELEAENRRLHQKMETLQDLLTAALQKQLAYQEAQFRLEASEDARRALETEKENYRVLIAAEEKRAQEASEGQQRVILELCDLQQRYEAMEETVQKLKSRSWVERLLRKGE